MEQEMDKHPKKITKPTPCWFCRQKEDGGKDVLKAAAGLGAFGKIEVGMNAYIWADDDVRKLSLWAWFDCGKYDGRSIVEKDMKINFCPMCGRKLGGSEDGGGA